MLPVGSGRDVALAVDASECQPGHTSVEEKTVPTYQYACLECGHRFEQVQSFSDDSLTACPRCEGRLRKLFNAVGVVFKGSGFYRNDSRAEAEKSAASSAGSGETKGSGEKTGEKAGEKSGEKKGPGEKSGETKAGAEKPVTAPASTPAASGKSTPAGASAT